MGIGRARGRALASSIAVGLVLPLLAGCGLGGVGGDDAPPTGPDGGQERQDDGERPTSIDPGLLECGDPAGADPTLQLTDVELTEATWDMPEGFVESFAYYEDHPVEHVDTTWTAEPATDPSPLDALSVVVYGELDWEEVADACGRVPVEAIEGRLADYADQIGARSLSDAEMTELAGLPAVRQDIELDEYSYRGYWLFDADQLMHVYCQWTPAGDRDVILAGCGELVESVEVPGG